MSITAAMTKLTTEVEIQTGVNLAFVVLPSSPFNSIFNAWYRAQAISLQDAVEQVADLLIECSVSSKLA